MVNYHVSEMFSGCPPFFSDFQSKMLSTEKGRTVCDEMNFKYNQTSTNGIEWFLGDLSKAASKWRVADQFQHIMFEDISCDLKDQYSEQLRVALSVNAFEQYCKMWRTPCKKQAKKWHEVFHLVTKQDVELCKDVRTAFTSNTYKALKNSAEKNLSLRLDQFKDGCDNQLYPVCVAIRNSFAHGDMGGNEQIAEIGKFLSIYTLESIKSHTKKLISDAA